MSLSISYTKKGPGRVSGNKAGIKGWGFSTQSGLPFGRFSKGDTKYNKIFKKIKSKTLGLKNSSGYKA